MNTPPPVSVTRAQTALENARRYRARALIDLAHGRMTPLDLLHQAATIGGRPLTRLSLRQVIGAVPGHGDQSVRRKLARIAAECGLDTGTGTHPALSRLTVGWLLDNRSRGARMTAWLGEFEVDKKIPAWPGFPFTAAPKDP